MLDSRRPRKDCVVREVHGVAARVGLEHGDAVGEALHRAGCGELLVWREIAHIDELGMVDGGWGVNLGGLYKLGDRR